MVLARDQRRPGGKRKKGRRQVCRRHSQRLAQVEVHDSTGVQGMPHLLQSLGGSSKDHSRALEVEVGLQSLPVDGKVGEKGIFEAQLA